MQAPWTAIPLWYVHLCCRRLREDEGRLALTLRAAVSRPPRIPVGAWIVMAPIKHFLPIYIKCYKNVHISRSVKIPSLTLWVSDGLTIWHHLEYSTTARRLWRAGSSVLRGIGYRNRKVLQWKFHVRCMCGVCIHVHRLCVINIYYVCRHIVMGMWWAGGDIRRPSLPFCTLFPANRVSHWCEGGHGFQPSRNPPGPSDPPISSFLLVPGL